MGGCGRRVATHRPGLPGLTPPLPARLDARHLVSHLLPPGRVQSLTTVGTPHRGSALASLFGRPLERIGLFKAASRWQVDGAGPASLPGAASSACGRSLVPTLPLAVHAVAALAELMPEYVEEEFNPSTQDVPETAVRAHRRGTGPRAFSWGWLTRPRSTTRWPGGFPRSATRRRCGSWHAICAPTRVVRTTAS